MHLDKIAFTSFIVSVISFDNGIVKKNQLKAPYEVNTGCFVWRQRPTVRGLLSLTQLLVRFSYNSACQIYMKSSVGVLHKVPEEGRISLKSAQWRSHKGVNELLPVERRTPFRQTSLRRRKNILITTPFVSEVVLLPKLFWFLCKVVRQYWFSMFFLCWLLWISLNDSVNQ